VREPSGRVDSLRFVMRRGVGAFEVLVIGWVALFVAGARPRYAAAVVFAALVAFIIVGPLVVYWRTCVPAASRGWWRWFCEPRRADGTFWGFLVVVFWSCGAVGAVARDLFAVTLGAVAGLLAWGALWLLVRRLLAARSAAFYDALDW
jgi:hypothetical protein